MKEQAPPTHYSYAHYRDPDTAKTFDELRFGGPIGELVAATQARVVADFVGRVENRPILDVGTGTGRAALWLARGGARVTGVDASEQMLAVARRRASEQGVRAAFVTGDAHALAFPNRSFDVAISLRVIMHAPRPHDCIAELCRVADQLVIFDYPSAHSLAHVQSIARRCAAHLGARTEPYRVFSHLEISAALELGGFRVRSVHRQFVLPIALHKAVRSVRFTTVTEGWLERVGLLERVGSPVTLVAERCAS